MCLRAAKTTSENYFTYAGRINTLVQKIDFSKMTEDQFKYVLFIVGLNSAEESDVDTEESDENKLTIDKLVIESQRFVSLRSDNRAIEKLAAPQWFKRLTREEISTNLQLPTRPPKISNLPDRVGVVVLWIGKRIVISKTKNVLLVKAKVTNPAFVAIQNGTKQSKKNGKKTTVSVQ